MHRGGERFKAEPRVCDERGKGTEKARIETNSERARKEEATRTCRRFSFSSSFPFFFTRRSGHGGSASGEGEGKGIVSGWTRAIPAFARTSLPRLPMRSGDGPSDDPTATSYFYPSSAFILPPRSAPRRKIARLPTGQSLARSSYPPSVLSHVTHRAATPRVLPPNEPTATTVVVSPSPLHHRFTSLLSTNSQHSLAPFFADRQTPPPRSPLALGGGYYRRDRSNAPRDPRLFVPPSFEVDTDDSLHDRTTARSNTPGRYPRNLHSSRNTLGGGSRALSSPPRPFAHVNFPPSPSSVHLSTASGFARAREIVRVGEEKRKETAKRRATVAARQGVAVGRRWTARLAVVRGAMTVSPLSHERRQRPHQTTPRAHSLPLHSPRRPLASPCLGPTNAILIGRKGGIQPRNDFPRCPAALFSSLYFFLRPSDLSLSFFPGSSTPLQRILLRPFSPIS